MTLAGALHLRFVHQRRVRVLAEHAARLIPPRSAVLDVGSGDGRLAAAIAARRPDLSIQGLDVLVRSETWIPVAAFDGRVIPRPSKSVDVVTLFDVLHHADDPKALLVEGIRIARSCLVVKDHVADGPLARAVLRVMDDIGNTRYGVAQPHNYWNLPQWLATTEELGLERLVWEVGGLGLYPWPASLVFGARLHLLAVLKVSRAFD
jgi:SAM-dependent methyltransferase